MLEDVGEISEILGRSYGMPDGLEEEDLDAELACLEEEWANEEVVTESAPAASVSEPNYSLPNQPSQVFPVGSNKANVSATAPISSAPQSYI
jgi:charged multivesicular body protein 5